MVDTTKWTGLGATIAGVVIIFLPAVFSVPYVQALTSLLLGEIGALAAGHTAYRAASGKQASPLGAVTTLVCGLLLTLSPILLAPVDPFLTIMLALGAVMVVGGAAAILERFIGGEEGRQTGAQRIANRMSEN
ncbi:hypothetical protein KTS45_04865 [Halomicroarcula limicola]|uniref:Uncharacterized protein n=1 Tax=Haloarcula limicola TaxID=1429915 RepID=A0A8J7Y370_9EURY|nr:hypothetical protein [Halomicroarcula limicola]MBV0923525.1 hypothetical protein [Halomicroarcula limicola]